MLRLFSYSGIATKELREYFGVQHYAKTHKTRALHDSSLYLYFNRFFR